MSERAPKGQTKGPCPACQKGEHHPTGDICWDCRQVYNDAKAINDAHQKQEVEAWFPFATASHWNPGYYLGFEIEDKSRERLARAMFDFVQKVATATLDMHAGNWRHRPRGLKVSRRPLIDRPKGLEGGSDRHSSGGLVLMRVAVAEAVNELDHAVIDALLSVSKHEREKGANLLAKLALGEVTLDDFNEDTARQTAEMHRRRELSRQPVRSKRVYSDEEDEE